MKVRRRGPKVLDLDTYSQWDRLPRDSEVRVPTADGSLGFTRQGVKVRRSGPGVPDLGTYSR